MIDLAARLAELDGLGLRRRRGVLETPQGAHVRVDGRDFLSFASNDYLGLAAHPAIAAAACAAAGAYCTGAGAAHLLTGHHTLHHRLEQELAGFVGLPAALLFSTGYMANLGVITALVDRHGAVFADKLNHASLVDAVLLSRAEHKRYRHADLAHLEQLLRESDAKDKLIATDAVFSMDGDLAPVPELLALAEKYDAWLHVDDAHGFGVLGEHGKGVLEHYAPTLPSPACGTSPQGAGRHAVAVPSEARDGPEAHRGLGRGRLIYLATLGKAAGVSGAFVAGSADLVEWLVNKARTYVYTTATPPMLAAAVSASLGLIAGEPQRRARLAGLIARLKAGVAGLPWPLMPSDTPIQPLLVGGNHDVLRLADGLRERGILCPAIRPPTVPEGSARLRISLSAGHVEADVDRLVAALRELA